jgi:hypothetical protein
MELPMINARARRQAARLLADFLEGNITNDEYNDAFPSGSIDAGLDAVYRRIWVYYSDLDTHYLDQHGLSEEEIAMFRRCIEFLNTNLEYQGPSLRFHNRFAQIFRNILGRDEEPVTLLGSTTVEASGLFSGWWPFASASEYEQARRRPDECS